MDTNVLVAAFRSSRGASHRLLRLVGTRRFQIALSVPLVLEYEDALSRLEGESAVSRQGINAVLDYLCSVAHKQDIFYLWRPYLRDPKDDLVLEVAVASQCSATVTFNQRDFEGVERFGLSVVSPREFLRRIGEAS